MRQLVNYSHKSVAQFAQLSQYIAVYVFWALIEYNFKFNWVYTQLFQAKHTQTQ